MRWRPHCFEIVIVCVVIFAGLCCIIILSMNVDMNDRAILEVRAKRKVNFHLPMIRKYAQFYRVVLSHNKNTANPRYIVCVCLDIFEWRDLECYGTFWTIHPHLYTFDGRQHLTKYDLWWKPTFDGRRLLT